MMSSVHCIFLSIIFPRDDVGLKSRSYSLLMYVTTLATASCLFLSQSVQSDCGFPGVPSGVLISRDTRLSLTYFEGESIHASCAFKNTDNFRILLDNNDHEQFVFPAVSVNYTLKCSQMNQWIIKSFPENIPWRSCSLTPKKIPFDGIRATAVDDDSLVIPVLFENDRSNCYSSILDISQKWAIQLDHPVTPCFVSIQLSMSAKNKLNPRSSELQVVDKTGHFNCSFLRYSHHPIVKYQRRRVQAIFVCGYSRAHKPLGTEVLTTRPRIDSLRLQTNEESIDLRDSRSHSRSYSSFFSQVSICSIEVQECESTCGSFPLPVKGIAREERTLDDDSGQTKIKYSCGDDSFVMKASPEYDDFGGLVCGFDGSWSSSAPECLSNNSGFLSLMFKFLSIPSDCISCVSLVCLFLLLIVTGLFLVAMIIMNYVWMRRRQEKDFIQGRESLLWIRKNFLSFNESNPRESLISSNGKQGSSDQTKKKRHAKRKQECPNTSLLKVDPCHSYFNMQGSLFGSELELPLGSVIPTACSRVSTASMSSSCSSISAPETVSVIYRHQQ